MSLEVQGARRADDARDAKTNLCICAPPFGSSGANKQLVQQGIDVEQQQQPWQQELCPPCDRPAGTPVRPTNLFNTKCFYFNQPGGCKRDDCRFLHDEEPVDVVFYDKPAPDAGPDYYASWMPDDGYYLPISVPPIVKVEDVRVFFGTSAHVHLRAHRRAIGLKLACSLSLAPTVHWVRELTVP